MRLMEVALNRGQGTAAVRAEADLDGTLLSGKIMLLANYPGSDAMGMGSKVERTKEPVEVVLAVDVSKSMTRGLDGTPYVHHEVCGMGIVKQAALALVDVLDKSAEERIAIGLVPCHLMVRLDDDATDRWVDNDWAEYPSIRHCATPYRSLTSDRTRIERSIERLDGMSFDVRLAAPPPDGY